MTTELDEKQPDVTQTHAVEKKETVSHATHPTKRYLSRTSSVLIMSLVVLILMGGAFCTGLVVGGHANRGRFAAPTGLSDYSRGNDVSPNMMGTGGARRSGMNRTMTTGTVSAISSSSITIQDTASSTQTYVIDSNTRFTKSDGTAGAVSDVTNGASVSIRSVTTAGKATAWVIAIR